MLVQEGCWRLQKPSKETKPRSRFYGPGILYEWTGHHVGRGLEDFLEYRVETASVDGVWRGIGGLLACAQKGDRKFIVLGPQEEHGI